MIPIFPLWTFHLYLAKFQQYLRMEYIYLGWSDIPEVTDWNIGVTKLQITLIRVFVLVLNLTYFNRQFAHSRFTSFFLYFIYASYFPLIRTKMVPFQKKFTRNNKSCVHYLNNKLRYLRFINHVHQLAILLDPLVCLVPKFFLKLFGFAILWGWACLISNINETRHAHENISIFVSLHKINVANLR